MLILTPQHPDFYETLRLAPAIWKAQVQDQCDPGNLIIDAYGNIRHLNERETQEFLMGGELEETYLDSELAWWEDEEEEWI